MVRLSLRAGNGEAESALSKIGRGGACSNKKRHGANSPLEGDAQQQQQQQQQQSAGGGGTLIQTFKLPFVESVALLQNQSWYKPHAVPDPHQQNTSAGATHYVTKHWRQIFDPLVARVRWVRKGSGSDSHGQEKEQEDEVTKNIAEEWDRHITQWEWELPEVKSIVDAWHHSQMGLAMEYSELQHLLGNMIAPVDSNESDSAGQGVEIHQRSRVRSAEEKQKIHETTVHVWDVFHFFSSKSADAKVAGGRLVAGDSGAGASKASAVGQSKSMWFMELVAAMCYHCICNPRTSMGTDPLGNSTSEAGGSGSGAGLYDYETALELMSSLFHSETMQRGPDGTPGSTDRAAKSKAASGGGAKHDRQILLQELEMLLLAGVQGLLKSWAMHLHTFLNDAETKRAIVGDGFVNDNSVQKCKQRLRGLREFARWKGLSKTLKRLAQVLCTELIPTSEQGVINMRALVKYMLTIGTWFPQLSLLEMLLKRATELGQPQMWEYSESAEILQMFNDEFGDGEKSDEEDTDDEEYVELSKHVSVTTTPTPGPTPTSGPTPSNARGLQHRSSYASEPDEDDVFLMPLKQPSARGSGAAKFKLKGFAKKTVTKGLALKGMRSDAGQWRSTHKESLRLVARMVKKMAECLLRVSGAEESDGDDKDDGFANSSDDEDAVKSAASLRDGDGNVLSMTHLLPIANGTAEADAVNDASNDGHQSNPLSLYELKLQRCIYRTIMRLDPISPVIVSKDRQRLLRKRLKPVTLVLSVETELPLGVRVVGCVYQGNQGWGKQKQVSAGGDDAAYGTRLETLVTHAQLSGILQRPYTEVLQGEAGVTLLCQSVLEHLWLAQIPAVPHPAPALARAHGFSNAGPRQEARLELVLKGNEPSPESGWKGVCVTLQVRECVGLPKCDIGSKNDTYVKVFARKKSIDQERVLIGRTSVVDDSNNPKWEGEKAEYFSFHLPTSLPGTSELLLEVWEEDEHNDDDFLGAVTLDMDEFTTPQPDRCFFPLQLLAVPKGAAGAPQRRNSMGGPTGFHKAKSSSRGRMGLSWVFAEEREAADLEFEATMKELRMSMSAVQQANTEEDSMYAPLFANTDRCESLRTPSPFGSSLARHHHAVQRQKKKENTKLQTIIRMMQASSRMTPKALGIYAAATAIQSLWRAVVVRVEIAKERRRLALEGDDWHLELQLYTLGPN
jgi:hypothetical protein